MNDAMRRSFQRRQGLHFTRMFYLRSWYTSACACAKVVFIFTSLSYKYILEFRAFWLVVTSDIAGVCQHLNRLLNLSQLGSFV